jgi:hypothetical protein
LHGPVGLPELMRKVFGAVEVERFEFGPVGVYVELQIGDPAIVVEAGELPPEVSPWSGSVYA